MAVIEPKGIAIGRPGFNAAGAFRTLAKTSTVRFGLDLTLDPLGTFSGVSVGEMNLPIGVDAGSGTAGLLGVTCAQDETSMVAVNRVTTSAARVAYGATKSAALLAPAGGSITSVRTPLVTLSVRTGLSGSVPIARITAEGMHEIPGATGDVTLPGVFPSRARFAGSNPFNGISGVGLSSIVGDLDLDTTILGATPGVTVGVGIGGSGTSVNLDRDVVAPALAAAAGVLDRVDSQVFGTILDALGAVAIADAETAATSVSCGSRRLVR